MRFLTHSASSRPVYQRVNRGRQIIACSVLTLTRVIAPSETQTGYEILNSVIRLNEKKSPSPSCCSLSGVSRYAMNPEPHYKVLKWPNVSSGLQVFDSGYLHPHNLNLRKEKLRRHLVVALPSPQWVPRLVR